MIRFRQRARDESSIIHAVRNGKVLYDDGTQRYVEGNGLRYPLVRGERNQYVIKSCLHDDMKLKLEEAL